jgi:predicted DNA-binding protein (MmcQ/YjbR family)
MKPSKRYETILAHLRSIGLPWPEAKQEIKWGHPVFVAGKKMFAGFGEQEGEPCLGFKVPDDCFDEILKDARFFPTPYAARFNWVSIILREPIDWKELAAHLEQSYRLVALKRMVSALDGAAVGAATKHGSRRKAR